MRITMIVHSVSGDEDGHQDASMYHFPLPDGIDRETAIELMSRLSTHIDDELKAIDEENEDEMRKYREARADQRRRVDNSDFEEPGCTCDSNADEDIKDDCPAHGLRLKEKESTKGEGWPK